MVVNADKKIHKYTMGILFWLITMPVNSMQYVQKMQTKVGQACFKNMRC